MGFQKKGMIQEPDINQLIDLWRQQAALNTYQKPSQLVHKSPPTKYQAIFPVGDQFFISIKPTPFLIRTQDSLFYALTALDCLQLPMYIKESVQVETNCPAYNTIIRLTLSSNGIEACEPSDCVLSVPIPNHKMFNSVERTKRMVSKMRYLSSTQAASLWLVAYTGVTVLDNDQAWELAKAIYEGNRENIQISTSR